MSDDNWWDKEFFSDKEKRKKAGKTSATSGLGFIALAFFLGYLFLHDFTNATGQVAAGFAFAVFCFLSLVYFFFGLFTGCYFIFFLPNWYNNALSLAGMSIIPGGHWLNWVAFYPLVFIGCLVNFGIIVFLAFKLVKWIFRKIRD